MPDGSKAPDSVGRRGHLKRQYVEVPKSSLNLEKSKSLVIEAPRYPRRHANVKKEDEKDNEEGGDKKSKVPRRTPTKKLEKLDLPAPRRLSSRVSTPITITLHTKTAAAPKRKSARIAQQIPNLPFLPRVHQQLYQGSVSWNIRINHSEFIVVPKRLLAKSGFSYVYEVTWDLEAFITSQPPNTAIFAPAFQTRGPQTFALKLFMLREPKKGYDMKPTIASEIDIWSYLTRQNMAGNMPLYFYGKGSLHQDDDDPTSAYEVTIAIMDYADAQFSDFVDQIDETQKKLVKKLLGPKGKRTQIIPELAKSAPRFKQTFHLLVSYVANLHSLGIIHGDLKPDNFVFSRGLPYIIDYGTSLRVSNMDMNFSQRPHLQTTVKTIFGTPNYLPPEVHAEVNETFSRGRMYHITSGVDIFALGVMFSNIIFGEDVVISTRLLKQVADVNLRLLIAQCLHPDPEKRLTAVELFNHPWFVEGQLS